MKTTRSDHATEVLIVGGGTGGVAAALAVAEAGRSCILVEPTPWIGGQLTSQAVPPDEHKWIEGKDGFHGATRRYVTFRNRVRDWYREHRDLTPAARSDPYLNPGGGWVSRLCFEPTIGVTVLNDWLASHVASGRVRIVHGARPVSADVEGEAVRGVAFDDGSDSCEIRAKFVLDATEFGDLYPLVGCDFMLGAEGRDVFDEPHGRGDLGRETDPTDQQAITHCFALEHRPGEDHTIDRPDGYAEWRDFVPKLTPPWPGLLFSWEIDDASDPRTLAMIPPPDAPKADEWELWRYRRIVDASIYRSGSRSDICLWNTVQTDFFRQPAIQPGADAYAGRAKVLRAAKEQARCFVYWLQTEAPRHDDGHGYAGLKLRGDELGTRDGFAMAAYVREPRRLVAQTILTENHVGFDARLAAGRFREEDSPAGVGQSFDDSVGIGHYPIDLHPTAAGRNSVYVRATPFQIPLGSLLPRLGGRGSGNLIAAGKAIGVSHVANGSTRLHPVEWGVGEAAGTLAAHCLDEKLAPRDVRESTTRLRDFQRRLARDGVELAWPWDPAPLAG